jgi:cell division protein ZapA
LSKCKIKSNIGGLDYVISSENSEDYMQSVVNKVNDRINEIMQKNEKFSLSMAATLAALDFCDEAQKADNSADNLRFQIKNYLEELNAARDEIETLRHEFEALKEK